MGPWSDATKEMARPQSVLGYPEAEDDLPPPVPPARSAPPATPGRARPGPAWLARRTSRRISPGTSRGADRGADQAKKDGTPMAAKAAVSGAKAAPPAAKPRAAAKDSAAKDSAAKGPAAKRAQKAPAGRTGEKGSADRADGPRGARPPMDPRFKERWVRVQREQGHRRLRAAAAAAAAVIVIAGGVGAAFSPLLAVRHVRVAVTAHVAAEKVLAVTGLGDHRPMVEVNAAAAVSRLDTLPWVASARVSRQWPSTVAVTITERRPVAQVAVAGGVVDVDATGRVLTQPQAATAALPALIGAPGAGRPGMWLAGTSRLSRPQGRVGASLAVASALPASVAARVATVTVDGHGTVTLALRPGSTTVTLGEVAAPGDPAGATAVTGSSVPVTLARQVAALSTLLSTVDLSKVAQIDLTVPDRPALTPTQTPTTLSTTSRG
ncbi:MAG: cell division protein FtsQ/DivIB [Acidimicrobiales bacterium]